MNVHVERDWMRRTVKVWAYEPRLGSIGAFWQRDGDGWTRVEYSALDSLPDTPTLELPEAMFEAMIREGSGIVPPSDATHAALTDAKAVRDRLMALVEAEWQSRQLERR